MKAEKLSVHPSNTALSSPNRPYWNKPCAIGVPKAVKNTTMGISAINVSLVATVRSRTTPLSSPSAALRDKRGIIAVSRVTPMTPYGT